MQSEVPDPRNLIINYIPTPVSDIQLYCLFLPYGEIETARVIRDRVTNHPKGYGFVKYKEVSSATEAIRKMDKYVIGNKRLHVSHATGREKKKAELNALKSKNNETYQTHAQSMPNLFSAIQNSFALQGSNTSPQTLTGVILEPQPSFTAIPILVQPSEQHQQQELQRSLSHFVIPACTVDQKKLETVSTAHIPAETSNAQSQEYSSYSLPTSQTFTWSPENVNLTIQSQAKPPFGLPSDNWQIHSNDNKSVNMSSKSNFTENYIFADASKPEVLRVYSLHNANTISKNDGSHNTSYSKSESNTNNNSISNSNTNNNTFTLSSSAFPVFTRQQSQKPLEEQQELHQNSLQTASTTQPPNSFLQAYTVTNSSAPSLTSYTAAPITTATEAVADTTTATTTTTISPANSINTNQLPLLPTVMLAQPNDVIQNTIPCISLPANQPLSQPINSVQLLQPQPFITTSHQYTFSQSTPSIYSASNEVQMVNAASMKGANEQNVNTSYNPVILQFQGQPLELLTSQSMPAYFSSSSQLEHVAQQNTFTVMSSPYNKTMNDSNSNNLLKLSESGSVCNTFVVESNNVYDSGKEALNRDALSNVTNNAVSSSRDNFSVFGNTNFNSIMPDFQADSSTTSTTLEPESYRPLSFVKFWPRTPTSDLLLESNPQSQCTPRYVGSDMGKFSTQPEFVNSQNSYGLTPYANIASQSAQLTYMNDTMNMKSELNAPAPIRLAFSNSSITEANNNSNSNVRNFYNNNNNSTNNSNQNWSSNSNNFSSNNINFLNAGTNTKLPTITSTRQTAPTSTLPLTNRMDGILPPSINKPNEQENQFAFNPAYRYQ